MAEASTTTEKKVSTSHILSELVFSILSKLPFKSLNRFTCVQKLWSLLFQNPIFINMFRNNFMSRRDEDYENTSLLLKERKLTALYEYHRNSVCTFFGDRVEDMVRLDSSCPFQENKSLIEILGSSRANGIICLYKSFDYYNTTTSLWNPVTGEFKIIPPSLQSYENIEFNLTPSAFGYDSIKDDYKVIQVVQYPLDFEGNWVFVPDNASGFWELDGLMHDDDKFWDDCVDEQVPMYDPFWEIYSLKSNSWRKLNPDGIDMDFLRSRSTHVNLNEMSHWLRFATQMVSFDFSNEKFYVTTLPSHSKPDVTYKRFGRRLMMLNGFVALICNYDNMNYFHIWILGELGVKESWTKLFLVGPLSGIDFPIGAGKKNDIYFKKKDNELARFNLCTQKFEKIKAHINHILIYKEVYLSIPHLVK